MLNSTVTLEFQMPSVVPQQWYADISRVWNQALFYLFWLQHYRRLEKCRSIALNPTQERDWGFKLAPIEIKIRKHEWQDANGKQEDWALYSDILVERRIDRTKSWEQENIELVPVNRIPYKFHSVNPCWMEPPPIASYSAIDLRKPFAKERCEWLKEATIPMVFVNDFIGLVVLPAWEAYQSGQRGKPRFKRNGDRVDTLSSESFRAQCAFKGGDRVKLPGLGVIEVHGLEARLIKPLDRLVAAMRSTPEQFPKLQEKSEKIRVQERSKLLKADGHDLKALRKELSEEQLAAFLAAYNNQIDDNALVSKAIEYFAKPGAFRLIRRNGKQYIQITTEQLVNATPTDKSVGVDSGRDLLVHATNGLRVEHEDFSSTLRQIDRLKEKRSKMQFGSANYCRISEKIRRYEGRIKRSRRAHQTYWAAEIADVNGNVALKLIKPQEAIEVPLPNPDPEGDRYLPNGRTYSKFANRQLRDCALGQFASKLQQQCDKRQRQFSKIDVEAEATAAEVLELAEFPLASASQRQPKTEAPAEDTGRGSGNAPHRKGKAKPTLSDRQTLKQVPEFVSPANTPKASNRPRRNRRREKRIG